MAPHCPAASTLYDSLIVDINDGELDDFTNIEAAFIISGTRTPDSLEHALQWHHLVLSGIREKNLVDVFEKEKSAEKVFHYLHAKWLRKYVREATTLLDIKHRKEFNCVSATILYNLTCDELGLNTMAFETPTHVYTIFSNFGHDIMVENTTSLGFNIIVNLDNYSRYMSQYYPENQIYNIGLHRLYAYENSKGRKISNTELLGLICYNQAYFSAENGKYFDAYDYVLMAQIFNQDSRSNVKFEINLYYRHGKLLYTKNDFHSAFQIFADAYYRYPTNNDFKLNCVNSYLRNLETDWINKNWTRTVDNTYDIIDLNLLDDQYAERTHSILSEWAFYFARNSNVKSGIQALNLIKLFAKLNRNDKNLQSIFESNSE